MIDKNTLYIKAQAKAQAQALSVVNYKFLFSTCWLPQATTNESCRTAQAHAKALQELQELQEYKSTRVQELSVNAPKIRIWNILARIFKECYINVTTNIIDVQ